MGGPCCGLYGTYGEPYSPPYGTYGEPYVPYGEPYVPYGEPCCGLCCVPYGINGSLHGVKHALGEPGKSLCDDLPSVPE